jgi:hypothetical protein
MLRLHLDRSKQPVSFFSNFADQAQRSPWFALLLGALLYLMSLLVFVPVLVLLVAMVFDLDFAAVQRILGGQVVADSVDTWVFRIIQSGNQLLTWGLVGLVMGSLMGGMRPALGLHPPLRRDTLGWQLVVAALVMAVAIPLVQWLQLDPEGFRLPEVLKGVETWMRQQEEIGQKALLAILDTQSVWVLLANLATFALVPAICEEVFFRGYVQRQLGRMMPAWAAIVVGGLLFSFIHFQFYGFFARAALGMLLGFLLHQSGSLWPSIAGHFCFNGLSILMAYLAATQPGVDPSLADQSYTFSWPFVLASLACVIGLSVAFARLSQDQRLTSSS